MNIALQKTVLKRRLRSRNVQPETVDIEALADPSLTLPENIKNIDKATRSRQRRVGQAKAREMQRKAVIQEGRRRHRTRPRWDRRIDESLDAETTFKNPDQKEFEMWASNPDKFDILGVDDKMPLQERTPAKRPPARKTEKRFRSTKEFSKLINDVAKVPEPGFKKTGASRLLDGSTKISKRRIL